jgi:hypothetical protein
LNPSQKQRAVKWLAKRLYPNDPLAAQNQDNFENQLGSEVYFSVAQSKRVFSDVASKAVFRARVSDEVNHAKQYKR